MPKVNDATTIRTLRAENLRLIDRILELEKKLKRWNDRIPIITTYMQAIEPVIRQLTRAREILFASGHDVSSIDEVIQRMNTVQTDPSSGKPRTKRPRVDSTNEAIHGPQHITREKFCPRVTSRERMPPPSNISSQPYAIPHHRNMISPSLMSKQEPHRFTKVFNGRDVENIGNIPYTNGIFKDSRATPNYTRGYAHDQIPSNRTPQHSFITPKHTHSGQFQSTRLTQPELVQFPRYTNNPAIGIQSAISSNQLPHRYSNETGLESQYIQPCNQPLRQYTDPSMFQTHFSQPGYQSYYQELNTPQPPVYNDGELDRQNITNNSLPVRTNTSSFFAPSSHERGIHSRNPAAIPLLSIPITPQRSSRIPSRIHSSSSGFKIHSLPPDAVITNVTSPFFGKSATFLGTEMNSSSRRRVQR